MSIQTTRRTFLVGAAATTALVVGYTAVGRLTSASAASADLVANPFVRITSDGKVVVIVKHFEMGQGTTTGLTTLVAQELDADWASVEVEFAPAKPSVYMNTLFGAQGTGGSTAMANSFEQYRKAGAAARDLMVRAAAKLWSVPSGEITVEAGVVKHGAGKSATFGELVTAAVDLEPISAPVLKARKDFKLIGNGKLPRKDSADKTDGTAQFAIDVTRPGMLYVVIARPPRFGASVNSVDDTAARKVRGVTDIRQIPQGVAVYAKNTWAAIKGREALQIKWDDSAAETRSTDAIIAEHRAVLDKPGNVARDDGDVQAALEAADKTIEAEFVFPFLAHAPMEPLNCVIEKRGNEVELWDGCQFPSLAQPTVAQILGVLPEAVTINTVYAGGSFGRRATPWADYHSEAAHALKAIDARVPLKLIWTREDDLKGGAYRPLFVHRIKAGLGADKRPVAWEHRLAGKSIMLGTFFEGGVKDGVDSSSVEGARGLPYAIPNLRVDVRNTKTTIPVLWWRSVGHTHTAYATEIVIDMLAELAGQDPFAFRKSLLAAHPRWLGVLELAAEKAGWGQRISEGRGRGIAVHESFRSYVAEVVEVSVRDGGAIKIDKVVCAVDCGTAVNPDVVRAQMEGGIGFGLGAAMRNKITLADGIVEQSNFPDYEPLRISDMPKVEVYIVPSDAPPTGVGEPGVPPAAPALANAIYAATGKRVTTLPMTDAGIEFV